MPFTHGGKTMQLPAIADARRNGIKAVPKPRTDLSQKNRIIEALGAVSRIPRVQEEPLFKYYEYLTEQLCFPFPRPFPQADELGRRGRILLHRVDAARPRETPGRRA